MKKLVLAMACVLSLALLASCKQEAASSDVTVSNQVATQSYSYKGTVSLTMAAQKNNTAGDAWIPDDSITASYAGNNTWGYSVISWDVKMGDNYQEYKLKLALGYKSSASADPVQVPTQPMTFYKLGDKYYIDDYLGADKKKSRTEIKFKDGGSPEDDEFTIESLGYVDGQYLQGAASGGAWKVTNVKFTRLD